MIAKVPGMGGDLGYRALLLVSEAVTAAVLALEPGPASSIELRTIVDNGHVRVEVRPRSAAPGPAQLALSSYATRIFRRTAARWGLEREPQPVIWFELAR